MNTSATNTRESSQIRSDAISRTELQQYSKRIASLLKDIRSLRSPLDSLLGAVHSLYRAQELKYRHRRFPLGSWYHVRLTERADAYSKQTIDADGPWLAGYYFNSALLRIAASFHQVLKAITSEDRKYIPQLIPLVHGGFKHNCLDEVHTEVNKFKHSKMGLDELRGVTPRQAMDAIVELLDLVDAQKVQILKNHPNSP